MIFACMFPQEQTKSGKIGDQEKKREQLCQGFERLCVCVCFKMISLCGIKAVMKHAQTISRVMCLQRDNASHTQTHGQHYRTRGRYIKAICISVG